MINNKLSQKELWYVLLVKIGREQTIKESLLGLEKELTIKDLIIPESPKNKFKDQEVNNRYKDLLGYILIKLKLDEYRYSILLQLENVYRFLGRIVQYRTTYYIPSSIPEQQALNIKRYLNGDGENINYEKSESLFSIGEEVEIISGDLCSIKGKIISLNKNYACISPQNITQIIKVPLNQLTTYV